MITGRLNKPIVIEHTVTTSEDILGEEIRERVDNIFTRADVVWGSGRRETGNMEVVYSYDVTFIVWMYLYDKIKEGDIVHYLGKKYEIVSMEPVPEQKMVYVRAQTL